MIRAKRVRLTLGLGTTAASRAMTNRQDSRFARPQVARRVAHTDVRHEIQRLDKIARSDFEQPKAGPKGGGQEARSNMTWVVPSR